MENFIDLTDLRSMTDGDSEVELLLFQEFYSSTEAVIDTLTANCTDGPNENWRSR